MVSFLGRFLEADRGVKEKIERYLLTKSKTGPLIEKNRAVVMLWEPEK